MITSGFNQGRIGVIQHLEKHPGGYDIIHVKDAKGSSFVTRISNVFVVGRGATPWITLPKGDGIRKTIEEESKIRLAQA